jgi:hypothetical protein
MPHIEHRIETISLDNAVLQNVFPDERSFPNLQLIYLKEDGWNMKLIVMNNSPQIVLQSSLNVLRASDRNIRFFLTSQRDYIDEVSETINILYMFIP